MRTPANIAKHPIHPMLVPVPIGLWIFSLVCDIVFATGRVGEHWQMLALYTMVGGIVGALVAAVFGIIDMLSLPAGIKRTALVHMVINLVVVVLFAVNAWLRVRGVDHMTVTWLSVIAVLALGVSGWLGGKLVFIHGVAVQSPPEQAADERQRFGVQRG